MTSSTKLTRSLVDVAMGRAHADLVIRGGKWVSVQSGEIIPNTDIAIVNGHIAYVGSDAGHTVGKKTKVIEAKGRYLVPGLLDAHMHVELGMVTVTEFVRAVAVRGTTGMFIDPHEIANVFGLKGVKLMVDEAQKQPIHVWVQMPSCVPSAPGFETPGSSIGPQEVAEAMKWKGIIGLGEMMNFPAVFMGDKKMLDEMSATHAAGKTIGGHYASPDLGLPFHGYVAGGAEDDHEGTRLEDAVARVRQGMKAMLRYGSAWYDVAAQVKAITEKKMDSRRFILCTDDSHAATLTQEGHMDRVLRHAISEGLESDDRHPNDDDQYRRTFWSHQRNGHDRTRPLGGCGAGGRLDEFQSGYGDCKRTGHCREWRVAGQIAVGEISQVGDEVCPFEEDSQSGGFCPSDESR